MQSIDNLNSLLDFSGLPFSIDSLIIEAGQRTVYKGTAKNGDRVVVKVLTFNEVKVGRIQREIRILSEVCSEYFPRFYSHAYISKRNIEDYIDNLDPNTNKDIINEFRGTLFKPFFVSCEEYIESIGWAAFQKQVSSEIHLVNFATHLFKALEILWERKIVHRDIKPDNILIRSNLRPVIIDLGIAKSLREGTQNFTLMGIAPCTPQYAAPEQFETGAEVTYKADQFAVGVILYHLVTGEFPYGRYSEIEIDGLLQRFCSPTLINAMDINKNLSAEFSQFLGRLIEVQPYKRFRNTNAIYDALASIRRNRQC